MRIQKIKILLIATVVLLLGIIGWRVWIAVRPPSVTRWKELLAAGQQYQRDRRFRKAERCYQQAIDEAKRLDPRHPRLADSYLALADLYDTERRFFYVYRQNTAASAPSPPVKVNLHHGLPAMMRAAELAADIQHAQHVSRDVLAIIACYRQALHVREVATGKYVPTLLPVLEKMAALTELKDLAGVQPYRVRIWQITDRAYGAVDVRTLDAEDKLVDLDCKLDLLAEAAQLRQRTLSRAEAKYGRDSVEILPALTALARVYRRTKAYHRAEPLYLRGIAIAEYAYHMPYTKMTDPHLYGTPLWEKVRGLLNDYAWQLGATGRTAEAGEMNVRLTD